MVYFSIIMVVYFSITIYIVNCRISFCRLYNVLLLHGLFLFHAEKKTFPNLPVTSIVFIIFAEDKKKGK